MMEYTIPTVDKNSHDAFIWENLGDIKGGRGDLGEEMPVLVYRLMQFAIRDVLTKNYGHEQVNEYFRQAGYLAGSEFSRHVLDLKVDFDVFIANLQKALENFKIGILHKEAFDRETGSIVLTVGQDLDCSGLPNTNETMCNYDEGFIAGILETYTEKKYDVSEVSCWANGDGICRFSGTVQGE